MAADGAHPLHGLTDPPTLPEMRRALGIARRLADFGVAVGMLGVLACSGEANSSDGLGADDSSADPAEPGPDDQSEPDDEPGGPGGEDDEPGSDDDSSDPSPGDDDSAADDDGVPDDDSAPDDDGVPDDDDEGPDPGAAERASAGVAVRLTAAEVNNVLRDLLGDNSNPASQFLDEEEYAPYDNDASLQTVSEALVNSLQVLAEDVAARAVSDTEARAQWMPCEPSSATDGACFDAVVQKLGRAFFRRAFSEEEVAPYRALLDFAEEQDDFFTAVELLLTSLLQDPEFLYRLERGTPSAFPGVLQLNDYEVATRLSFLLWGSTPDEALLAAADRGELTDGTTRGASIERLLTDPRARAQLHRFHAMWLGYRAIPHDAELNANFQLETEKLIERVVFDDPGDYLRLFQSDETYVTETLAAHYGFDAPAGGEGWVTYPADSQRAGILSHGSVLSAFSKFSDTSPTQRGILVRTRLLCLGVPDPPAVVDVDQPPSEVEGGCKVDRYRAHREQSGCAECHNLFEPIGVGLENFDMAGRYREHDEGDPDCLITERGSLPGYGDFSGPRELSQLLVDNRLVEQCMVRQYLQFALAKGPLSADDARYANQLADAFATEGRDLQSLLLQYATSERFAMRLEESP